jgi:hypothetical protein
MRQGDRQPSPQCKPKRYALFAMLQQHKYQTENRNCGEKAEFEILPTVKKVVEVPVILSPRTDG